MRPLDRRHANKRAAGNYPRYTSFGGIIIRGFETETESHTNAANSPLRIDSKKELNNGNLNPDIEILGVGKGECHKMAEKPVQDMCT